MPPKHYLACLHYAIVGRHQKIGGDTMGDCLLAVTPSKTLSPRCQVAGSKRGGTTRTGGVSGARGRRGVGASQGAGSQPLATRRGDGATAAATACRMSGAATGCRTSGVAGSQPGRAPEPPE
uniref:Uncharacterized protein n=1 Tax=Oryza barthii TaxID=65489 RepID=A0A0D3HNA9_9ORYZ